MAIFRRIGTFQRDSKTDTYVTCPECAWEIRLACTARPPAEFSVECPNCTQRKIYQSADAHDPIPSTAMAKTHRRPEFSTRDENAVRPRTWLNELVHSL